MLLKWIVFLLAVGSLGIVLWASDKITYEGERTIYTVACEDGAWEGLRCRGRMMPSARFRFRASTSKQEVLYWVVGSPEPSGKYSNCKVKDRGNWTCPIIAGQPSSITHEMVHGRPTRSTDGSSLAFRAVPKWVWWMLDAGIPISSRAGY